jgi:mannosyl-oligosaccharide alpha-1,2-mannosidase
MDTCVRAAAATATGLPPEIWWFDGPRGRARVKPADAFSLLRPETAESLFVLWRVTQDQRWRDAGWALFVALEQHAAVPSGEGVGYAAVENVNQAAPSKRRDTMESFFLGETLKYLFLLFDDTGLLPLDRVVFNTEAHPFPIWQWEDSKTDSPSSAPVTRKHPVIYE